MSFVPGRQLRLPALCLHGQGWSFQEDVGLNACLAGLRPCRCDHRLSGDGDRIWRRYRRKRYIRPDGRPGGCYEEHRRFGGLLFHGENFVDSGKEELDDIDENDDTAEDPAESPLGLSATTFGRTSQGRKADVAFLALGGRPGNQGGGSRSWVNPTANLLNVAVSRAKRRIYVIDNLADWRQGTYTSRIAKDLPAGGK